MRHNNMVSTIRRLFFPLVLLCTMTPAQDIVFPCQAPADIRHLTLDEIRTRLNAGQDDFFLYKRLTDLTPMSPKPGVLAAEFQQKLQQHPDDPRFLYLYAKSLIGKNTPEAIVYLNRTAEEAPGLPWTYAALVDIYASHNFRDDTRVIANVRKYRKLCPGNPEAFRYLEKVKDASETAEAARQLRMALEGGEDPDDGRYWVSLWAAEFRVTPSTEHDALRKRVAKDVERLKSRPEPWNRNLLIALADGYRLTMQTEAAAKMDMLLDPDQEAHKAYRAWEEKRGVRNRITPEEHRVDMEDLSKVSAAWVLKWPTSGYAWQTRLTTLTFQANWTKEEMEKIGEEVLKADRARSMGWTYIPGRLRVAQEWVRHGIRLRDCVAMAEASLDQISLGPAVTSDLIAQRNEAEITAARSFGFDTSAWDAMTVVVDGSAQLKDFDKARRMLSRMRQWLNDNESKKDDPTSGYMRFEARYLHWAGAVAEAEGHKVDALALYVRATAAGLRYPSDMEHAHALWEEQGGTKAGWELSMQQLPTPTPGKAFVSLAVMTANEYAAWKKVGQALPEMNLRDTSGKTWTLADFKGKTLFVNLWATWCPPCRDELPHLQKLYELAKQRPDIQVITLNADENPGELQPFLSENHYTFPVIIARPYLDGFAGSFPIPQNWLVDGMGILRQKSVGFDAKSVDWPQQMLDRLTHMNE